MAIDFGTALFGLLGLAVAVTSVFLYIRLEKFEDSIPELIDQSEKWLTEIEGELKACLAHSSPSNDIEEVVSIASKFSAVKAIETQLDDLEVSNSERVRTDIVGLILLVVTGGLLYGASFPDATISSDFTAFSVLAGLLAVGFWVSSVVSFYSAATKMGELKIKIRKKIHSDSS